MDPEVEALYGLPLDEFTNARDALARARSKEQGKDAGAAVKALRKPSVVAWALNQLARTKSDDVEALLEAGARLQRAQVATLEGGDPDELREATRAEAGEVQALAGQAASMLRSAGRGGSPAHEERLATTLRAAAVDPEAGDLLRRGALTSELSPSGFGFGVGEPLPSLSLTSSRSAGRSQQKQKDEAGAAVRKEEERAERERRREQERELRAARETATRLECEAEHAEERAREAREKAEAAGKRAEELAQELAP